MTDIGKQIPDSRIKGFILNIGLFISSIAIFCLVVFICGEIFLRIQFGSVPPGPSSVWYQYDDRIGWVLKPGDYSFFHVPAFRRVDLSVNEFGLRNKPISAKTHQGQTRVSVLGDSFVFGAPLSDGETLTDQMQRLAGDEYEIVNVSAERYGTGQQIRLLERLQARGYELGSKLVLVFFTNDLLDNLALTYDGLGTVPRQPAFRVDDAGRLAQIGPEPPDQGTKKSTPTIYKKSLFYRYLLHNLTTVATAHPNIAKALFSMGLVPSLERKPGVIAAWYGAGWEERWANTHDILTYFVDELRKDKASPELYIALIPSPIQAHELFSRIVWANRDQDPTFEEFLEDMDRPQKMLKELCESLGVVFIDTTPTLRKAPIAYFPHDGHLNNIGTDIVARVLLEHITAGE